MPYKLGDIAEHLQAELHGDPECLISELSTLADATPDCLSFLSNHRYIKQLESTQAAAVILDEKHASNCPAHVLVVDNPYLGYALAAQLLYPTEDIEAGVHATASIADSARIDSSSQIDAHAVVQEGAVVGANVYVAAGCVVGTNVAIGDNSRLLQNTVICHDVVIGKNVLIHPGVVIGADGFGLAEQSDGSWIKIPQIGSVIIEDDVEIGANTTIDRGALGNTHIGRGVKIDNQVQIGHNVIVGEFTAIAGCTGIAGSAKLGKRCRIGGGCGISGHLEIADDVILTGMSAVNNSISQSGIYSSPLSATDNKTWRKNVARFHRLDESFKRIRDEINELKND